MARRTLEPTPTAGTLSIDADRDVLVGATFVGPEVANLLHAATIAVAPEVPLRTLPHAVPAGSELRERGLEPKSDPARADPLDAPSATPTCPTRPSWPC